MLVMVGASASGKTEISKMLIKHSRFKKMVTFTTRPIREGEKDGIDYYFLDKKAFLLKKDRGEFIETVEYANHFYGTAFKEASINSVLIVDPNGANVLNQKLDEETVFFYLEASEAVRTKRMKERGDHLRDIQTRIQKDRAIFHRDALDHVDYVINTNVKSLLALSNEIYSLYTHHIKKTIVK